MKRLTKFLALISIFSLGFTANAQNTKNFHEETSIKDVIKKTHIIRIDRDTAALSPAKSDSLINIFYLNQYRHFQDPKAPYLLFMSKSHNLAMGIGGTIRLHGWLDWNGSIDGNQFLPVNIPLPKDPLAPVRLGGTAGESSILFTLFGHSDRFGEYLAYIDTRFDGYNGVGLRLRKAFFSLGDWTIGYATSTFCDPATTPPTIDYGGPCGVPSKTNLLIRYFHTFKNKHFIVGGGVEMPTIKGANDMSSYAAPQTPYSPDIIALGQFQWDNTLSHVRLSGLMRLLPWRDVTNGTDHTTLGWGLQLSAVTKIGIPWTLYAQGSIGAGDASYINNLQARSFDLMYTPSDPSKMYAPATAEFTVGAKYYWRSNIYSGLSFSQVYLNAKKDAAIADTFHKGTYAAANIFWDITSRFQGGLEYLFGMKENFSGAKACVNRLNILLQLSY